MRQISDITNGEDTRYMFVVSRGGLCDDVSPDE